MDFAKFARGFSTEQMELLKRMNFGYDDDEDDDTMFDDEDFDDEKMDKWAYNEFSFMDGKPELTEQVNATNVSFERETLVANMTKHIDVDQGLLNVYAAPASGKTQFLPEFVREKGQNDVVVVVPDAVLACVAASKGEDASFNWGEGKIAGPDDLQYVTRSVMLKAEENGKIVRPGVHVMMDEMQDGTIEAQKLKNLAMSLASTNRVYLLYGTKANTDVYLPKGVTCIKEVPDWKIGSFKKVLVVHSSQIEVQAAAMVKNTVYLMPGYMEHNIKAFRAMKEGTARVIHATYEMALGMDLDIDVVYGSKFRVLSGGQKRLTTIEEHYQMANRLCRYSETGKYFGSGDELKTFRTSVKVKLEVQAPKIHKPKIRTGKPRPKPVALDPVLKLMQEHVDEKLPYINVEVRKNPSMKVDRDFYMRHGKTSPVEPIVFDQINENLIAENLRRTIGKVDTYGALGCVDTFVALKNRQNELVKEFYVNKSIEVSNEYRKIVNFVRDYIAVINEIVVYADAKIDVFDAQMRKSKETNVLKF